MSCYAIAFNDYLTKLFGDLTSDENVNFFNILREFMYGDNHLKIALFMVGDFSSGKSFFCNILNKALGTLYSTILYFNMFDSKKGGGTGNEATPQINLISNKRIVRINEITKQQINGELFKKVTGNDMDYYRKLFKEADAMNMVPPYSFVFIGNNMPNINILDTQSWQRVYIHNMNNNRFAVNNNLHWLYNDKYIFSLFIDFILNYPIKVTVIEGNAEELRNKRCPLFAFIKKKKINIIETSASALYKLYKQHFLSTISNNDVNKYEKCGLSYVSTFNGVYNSLLGHILKEKNYSKSESDIIFKLNNDLREYNDISKKQKEEEKKGNTDQMSREPEPEQSPLQPPLKKKRTFVIFLRSKIRKVNRHQNLNRAMVVVVKAAGEMVVVQVSVQTSQTSLQASLLVVEQEVEV